MEFIMISYAKGDLIKTVKTGVILHGCNCLGIFGAGFALQLKRVYPENFSVYEGYCQSHKADELLGTALIHRLGNPIDVLNTPIDESLIIVNAFTQRGVGGRKAVSYDAIDQIFYDIYTHGYNSSWNSHIHMPMIGSGLGGGDWNAIEAIISSHLPEDKDITVWKL
jgi:O-acetyl-ADP-ribose deacetylase (regulator of RNase III)